MARQVGPYFVGPGDGQFFEWLDHFAGQVPAAPVNEVRAALDNSFVTRLTAFTPTPVQEGRRSAWSPAPS